MAHLDVIVIDAQTFSKAALIQIAGRVGRKAHARWHGIVFTSRHDCC